MHVTFLGCNLSHYTESFFLLAISSLAVTFALLKLVMLCNMGMFFCVNKLCWTVAHAVREHWQSMSHSDSKFKVNQNFSFYSKFKIHHLCWLLLFPILVAPYRPAVAIFISFAYEIALTVLI